MKKSLIVTVAIMIGIGGLNVSTAQGVEEEYADFILEEVVVTARKQSENLQNVPIAISAVTSDMMSQQGINLLDEITRTMPNVSISREGGGQGSNIFSIRGMSTDNNNPGFETGIGLYIDEVYVGKSFAFNTALWGAERVEVLRGPQGTLFGRNTIGGVLNITTKSPGQELAVDADITYGNYDLLQIRGLISGPIVKDKLSGLLAGTFKNRDGYLTDLVTGGDYNNDDNYSLRGKLQYDVSDTVNLDISADYYSDDNTMAMYDNVRFIGGPANFMPYEDTPLEKRTIATDFDGHGERDISGVTGRVTWDRDNFNITSITAYRSNESDTLADRDFTTLDFYWSGRKDEQSQFSQEIRFASQNQDTFNYLIGLYYFHSDSDARTTAHLGEDALSMFTGAPVGFFPGETVWADADIKGDAYAIFGSFQYEISESFELDGGIRYSYEDKDIDYLQTFSEGAWFGIFAGFAAYIPPLTDNVSEGAFSGDLSLSYRIKENTSLYVSYRHGFKAGGFNGTIIGYNPERLSFDKETVDQIEIGFKSMFMDNRLRLNTAVFYLDYQDKQEQISRDALLFVDNAGEATIKGFEIELAARPHPKLQVFASFGYLDTEYDTFDQGDRDYAGNRLMLAPEYTASIGGMFVQPLTDKLFLTLNADLSYEDESFSSPSNDSYYIKEAGTVANARIALESADGKWSLALWSKNIFENTRVMDPAVDFGTLFAYLSDPRTVAIEAKMNF